MENNDVKTDDVIVFDSFEEIEEIVTPGFFGVVHCCNASNFFFF